MRYYGLWYGGSSYGASELSRDLEVFGSIESAKGALSDRYHSGSYPHTFDYVRGIEHAKTPAVSDASMIELWKLNPLDHPGMSPDFEISFGPRMGVQVVYVGQWTVKLRHDRGTVQLSLAADTARDVIDRVCGIEGAPASAVVSVKPRVR